MVVDGFWLLKVVVCLGSSSVVSDCVWLSGCQSFLVVSGGLV